MLEALGDPYTVYMTKEEYSAFLNSVNGETSWWGSACPFKRKSRNTDF